MAETVPISQPSFFLNGADASRTAQASLPKPARQPISGPKDTPKASATNGITKRKQSKSRNGMFSPYRQTNTELELIGPYLSRLHNM
jgi:hypothetical protein